MGYLRDQVLWGAIDTLASDAPLRTRLASIAIFIGPRICGEFDDEPVLLSKMRAIYARLVEAGPGDDGKIDATTKSLSDEQARTIASEIVSLVFSEIRRAEGHLD